MTTPNPKPSFEEAIVSLEEIVSKLEAGDVPLEVAISLFQEGMTLSGVCNEKLAAVESQIQTIVEQNGTAHTKPFQLNPEN